MVKHKCSFCSNKASVSEGKYKYCFGCYEGAGGDLSKIKIQTIRVNPKKKAKPRKKSKSKRKTTKRKNNPLPLVGMLAGGAAKEGIGAGREFAKERGKEEAHKALARKKVEMKYAGKVNPQPPKEIKRRIDMWLDVAESSYKNKFYLDAWAALQSASVLSGILKSGDLPAKDTRAMGRREIELFKKLTPKINKLPQSSKYKKNITLPGLPEEIQLLETKKEKQKRKMQKEIKVAEKKGEMAYLEKKTKENPAGEIDLPDVSAAYGCRMYLVKNGGAGSFLDPPNYSTHKYSVEGTCASGSVEYYAKDFPKNKDLKKAMKWNKKPLSHPEVKKWMRYVYSYFANSYSPDGKTRDVSRAVFPSKGKRKPSPNRHLGYMSVKKFYPNHKPNKTLIGAGTKYYGQGHDYKKIVNPLGSKKKLNNPLSRTETKKLKGRMSSTGSKINKTKSPRTKMLLAGKYQGFEEVVEKYGKKNPANPGQVSKAARKFRQFHGFNFEKKSEIEVPNPKVLYKIGKFTAAGYESAKEEGGGDGTPTKFIHEFKKGQSARKGICAVDPEANMLLCWTPIKVTKRGIEDKA